MRTVEPEEGVTAFNKVLRTLVFFPETKGSLI